MYWSHSYTTLNWVWELAPRKIFLNQAETPETHSDKTEAFSTCEPTPRRSTAWATEPEKKSQNRWCWKVGHIPGCHAASRTQKGGVGIPAWMEKGSSWACKALGLAICFEASLTNCCQQMRFPSKRPQNLDPTALEALKRWHIYHYTPNMRLRRPRWPLSSKVCYDGHRRARGWIPQSACCSHRPLRNSFFMVYIFRIL